MIQRLQSYHTALIRTGVSGHYDNDPQKNTNIVFPKLFSSQTLFWIRKITTDPHILAHVNIECADDRYTKLRICIAELI